MPAKRTEQPPQISGRRHFLRQPQKRRRQPGVLAFLEAVEVFGNLRRVLDGQHAQLRIVRYFLPGNDDPELPVHTAWDLGYGDATAIWFYQVHFGEVRVIDYYQNNGEGIEHYLDILKSKGYKYGKHRVPHDARHGTMAAGGKSIILQASALGYTLIPISIDSISNRIEAGRKTLEVSWFDAEKCKEGLACLKQYQYEYDKDKQTYRDSPRHDWTSHGSDAWGYLAQTWREVKSAQEKEPPKFWEHQQAKDLFFPDRSSRPVRQRI